MARHMSETDDLTTRVGIIESSETAAGHNKDVAKMRIGSISVQVYEATYMRSIRIWLRLHRLSSGFSLMAVHERFMVGRGRH